MLASERAAEVLSEQAKVFVGRAQAGRWGHDPEEIHQARVASRRLRAALRVFKAVLPDHALALQPELKWIAGLLGSVRDLDVQIRRLQSTAADVGIVQEVVPYGGWLEALREHSLASLEEATHTPRFAQLVELLQALDVATPSDGEQLTIDDFVPVRLKRTAKKLRKVARSIDESSPDAMLHKARIRAKRLRYAVEFFEPTYGKRARRLIGAATDLQDLLGDHQDGVVNTSHVHEAIATAAAAWPAETSLALGRLVQWEAQHRADLRQHFTKAYGEVEDAWERLGKAL